MTKERITITLEKSDLKKLDEMAEEMDRTISDVIRQLIRGYD